MIKHLIVPPPHLMNQWESEAVEECRSKQNYSAFDREALKLIKAASWGANQELEACVQWLRDSLATPSLVECFLAVRRPNQQSLKDQALEALEALPTPIGQVTVDRFNIIRRAIEQLPDDTSLDI